MTSEATSNSAEAQQAGKKKKMILVVVLSIGLVIALLTQPKNPDDQDSHAVSEKSQQTASTSAAAIPSAIAGEPSQASTAADDRLLQIRRLSRMELDTITGLELLAAEPRRMRREGIKNARRVDAIYASPTGHAALLGDSIVRGGQPLPDGRRVLNVTAEGIEISY